MYTNSNKINRCRPGHNASCSLCCGSHNYTVSQEEIEDIFIERGRMDSSFTNPGHPDDSSLEKLFPDAIQCPNVGIGCSGPGIICCLIYENSDQGGDIGSFFNGTCRTFFCPAWDCLTDEEVLFAARLMGDWCYYSLLINDIEAVKSAYAQYGNPENVPDDRLALLKDELRHRLIDEDGK